MLITLQQFRDAMIIVETYSMQIKGCFKKSAKEIGCRVELSEYGKESLKEYSKPHNRKGTIIDWFNWCSTATYDDGLVTVKWDGVSKPETMHIDHVRPISKT